jgi:hypothetical protein
MLGKWKKQHGCGYLPPYSQILGGRRGRDRVGVGFTTTYAIGAFITDVVNSNLDQDEVYNIM